MLDEMNLKNNELRKFYFSSFILFCIFMIVVSVFQLFGLNNDYFGYQEIFTYNFGTKRKATEPFFLLLRLINDAYFNSSLIFIYLFTSCFSFYVKWNAFKRITNRTPYLLFLFHTFCFFWILEYTQIRASCAIAIFLYSIPDLIEKKSRQYLFKALIATLFHYSGFFMVILFLYDRLIKHKTVYIVLPLFGFLFAIVCDNILGAKLRALLHMIERSIGLSKSGNISDFMSPFNSKYLMLLLSFFLNSLFTPKSDRVNYTLMKSMSFGLCIFYWLNPIGLPVISVRLAEFFTSVFVLYFFNNVRNIKIKEKKIVKFGWFMIVVLYSIASIRTGIL